MNHIKTRTKEQILDDWIGVKDAHKRTEYGWILSAMDDWGTEVIKNLHKNHINDNELNTKKNILTEQSNYSINVCLKELQFNRPADAQRHIDKLISISTIIA